MSFSKVRHAVSAETCALPDTYRTFGGKYHARLFLLACSARARAHADVLALDAKRGKERAEVKWTARLYRLTKGDPGEMLGSTVHVMGGSIKLWENVPPRETGKIIAMGGARCICQVQEMEFFIYNLSSSGNTRRSEGISTTGILEGRLMNEICLSCMPASYFPRMPTARELACFEQGLYFLMTGVMNRSFCVDNSKTKTKSTMTKSSARSKSWGNELSFRYELQSFRDPNDSFDSISSMIKHHFAARSLSLMLVIPSRVKDGW